ncbi:MAG: CopG family transcriptional regulator [Leptospiraceae bacterium]|nr:CopG family transcriptional regulator [Leptospiraceae bacterium]
MKKINKRFQLLLTDEEMEALKNESLKRGISSGELLRLSLHNEIYKKTSLEKMNYLKQITEIFP